jgi:hypothetical protein
MRRQVSGTASGWQRWKRVDQIQQEKRMECHQQSLSL